MEWDWIVIIYAILLIDSLGAILMSWFGRTWWMRTGAFAEYFPPAKGWAVMYFVLVVVIGHLLGYF